MHRFKDLCYDVRFVAQVFNLRCTETDAAASAG